MVDIRYNTIRFYRSIISYHRLLEYQIKKCLPRLIGWFIVTN